jgi:hypothetical protein
LLDSQESLTGLRIARYLPSGNERKRVHGVPTGHTTKTGKPYAPTAGKNMLGRVA